MFFRSLLDRTNRYISLRINYLASRQPYVDARVGGVQPSVRASRPHPDMSAHTATARCPRACAVAVADGPGWSPTCAPCRRDRGAPRGVASRLAAHGARGSPQHPGYHLQRMARGQAQAQDLTVFRTHVYLGSLRHGNTLAHQGL